MGMIVSSRRENSNVIVETMMDHSELVQLKGELDDVHLFSEKVADIQTNIIQRGKNEATKYFLIPKQFRKDLDVFGQVQCQRINTPDKAIFIYVVPRTDFLPIKKIRREIRLEVPLNHEID